MAAYRYDELQTLGDLLARMKSLPDPPPGASESEQARTQQHNDALAQLQGNARVARALAENAINRGGAFPDSLLHFVPEHLLGPLAATRRGEGNSWWADQPEAGSSNQTADPWASYANSAFANAQYSDSAASPTTGNHASIVAPPIPARADDASVASGAPPSPRQPPATVLKGPVFPPIPPNADITGNMNTANAHRNYPEPLKYLWFYNQVHNRAPWDYKTADKGKYAPFGNFNYGATGAMLGIPLNVLLRMAGSAQIRDGNSSPAFGSNPGRPLSLFGVGGVAPYGDDPADQAFIKKGFRYARPFVHPPVALSDGNGVPLYR